MQRDGIYVPKIAIIARNSGIDWQVLGILKSFVNWVIIWCCEVFWVFNAERWDFFLGCFHNCHWKAISDRIWSVFFCELRKNLVVRILYMGVVSSLGFGFTGFKEWAAQNFNGRKDNWHWLGSTGRISSYFMNWRSIRRSEERTCASNAEKRALSSLSFWGVHNWHCNKEKLALSGKHWESLKSTLSWGSIRCREYFVDLMQRDGIWFRVFRSMVFSRAYLYGGWLWTLVCGWAATVGNQKQNITIFKRPKFFILSDDGSWL